MKYPTPSDYVEALQFPEVAFAGSELARGEIASNALGLPRVITGAYAAVFKLTLAEASLAVRCFLTNVPGRERRYRAIASHLGRVDAPFIPRPQYRQEGVRVGERVLPVVTMPWVPGVTLDSYIERQLGNPDTLLALRDALQRLSEALEDARIVHGDLQHGNILVSGAPDTPALHLVDHDAMWVPAHGSRAGTEVGHRNYQHPDRAEGQGGAHTDRFSALVLHVAITALAREPALWARFSTGENVLFRSDDFLRPRESSLFEVLRGWDPPLPAVAALERACLMRPSALPPLADVLAGELPSGPPRPRRQRGQEPEARTRGEALFAPGAAIVLLLVASLVAIGQAGLAVLAAAVSFIASSAMVALGRGRTSAMRRRRRLAREANVIRQWVADLDDHAAELASERAEFLVRGSTLRQERLDELREAALENRLKHHFIGDLSANEAVGHRAVVRLKGVGIRNAYHATADQVARVREMRSSERAAVERWRNALIDQYVGDLPSELSAPEEQRLRRMVDRRLRSVAEDLARVQAKASLQRKELAHVEAQLDLLPRVSAADYLGFLLRLRDRPDVERFGSRI